MVRRDDDALPTQVVAGNSMGYIDEGHGDDDRFGIGLRSTGLRIGKSRHGSSIGYKGATGLDGEVIFVHLKGGFRYRTGLFELVSEAL